MWNISLPDFRIHYVILLKGGIHKMYCVKWKMTILCLTILYFCYLSIIMYFALIYYNILF